MTIDEATKLAQHVAALSVTDPSAARQEFRASWRELAQVSPALVRQLASELSMTAPDEDPVLMLAFAAALESGTPSADAIRLLERLRDRVATTDDDAPMIADVELELAAAYRRSGRLADAATVLDRIESGTAGAVALPEELGRVASARYERMLIALHEGRFGLAGDLARQGSAAGDRSEAARESKAVAAFVAWTRGVFGEVDAQLATLDPGSSALAEAVRCLVAVERGQLEAAGLAADAAERLGSGTEWEGFVRYARATTAVLSGDTPSALNELDRAERAVLQWQGAPIIPTLCAGMRAVILLHMGQVEAAIEILERLEPTENHSNCPGRFRAALALLRGDLGAASRALSGCVALGPAHSERTLVDVLALEAAIAYEEGDEPGADLAFDRALRVAAANQMQATFYLLQSAVLDAMLARALERTQPAAVREYIIRVRASGATRPYAFIEPLSEREREVAVLAADGGTVGTIALGLWISANTAKAHLRSIYRKLGVSSREQLRRRLRALGVEGTVDRDGRAR